LEGVYQKLTETLDDFKIVYPGIVDTLDRAEEAGAEFAQEQVSGYMP